MNDAQSHDHDHELDESHEGMLPDSGIRDYAARFLALKDTLIRKGIITEVEIKQAVHELQRRTPTNGAKVVARAWVDQEYKERLLTDPASAIAELGFTLDHATTLVVVENTVARHNVIVCTLCSCYPTSLLGPPPDWYKSLAYRSRAVSEPRKVIEEFGLELQNDIQVRVHDSTADVRYLVLPLQPAGTEHLNEEDLAALVTRDSMIGVTTPLVPVT